ncbi:hypothetical protein [Burkholderia sp. PU8-34]
MSGILRTPYSRLATCSRKFVCGDVAPTTTPGRIDSVLLGMQGVLATGMVTSAFGHAVQEAARRGGMKGEARTSCEKTFLPTDTKVSLYQRAMASRTAYNLN